MELNTSNLAAELKRKLTSELPLDDEPGGMSSFTVRTFITSPAEMALCEEALKILRVELASEHPAWTVDVEGYPGGSFEVAIRFSR